MGDNNTKCMPSEKDPKRISALRWMSSQRFKPLLILMVGSVLIFGCQRAILLWLNRSSLSDADAGTILRVFLVGLRYDLQVFGLGAVLLIPFLSFMPSRYFSRKWFRIPLVLYIALILTVTATVAITDAYFFEHWGVRLNRLATDYMADFQVIGEEIWNKYPIVKLMLGIASFMACAVWLVRKFAFRGPTPTGAVWPRPFYFAGLASVAFLCVQGTSARRLFDCSEAYFSYNRVVTELSLNPISTYAAALYEYWTEGEEADANYPLIDDQQAIAETRQMLDGPSVTFAGSTRNPLWRTEQTGRPRRDDVNVVIIVMESFSGHHVGSMGFSPSQTPFFDRLKDHGLYFTNMYASGERTSRGLASMICGFPDIGGLSVLKRRGAQGTFHSLARIFGERDYSTYLIYGGYAHFDNMRRFFLSNGIEHLTDRYDMDESWATHWGVADHHMFAKANEQFERAAERGKPFFGVVLTLTNHDPYDIPPGCIEEYVNGEEDPEIVKQTNAIRYADWSMEQFFKTAAASKYYDNTVFVLVADHGRRTKGRYNVEVSAFHIPCLIYAPGRNVRDLVQPGKVDITCGQTDVGPTLLGLLGGDVEHCMYGRNLLTVPPGDPGFAMLCSGRHLALVRGGFTYVLHPTGSPSRLYALSADRQMNPLDDDQDAEVAERMHNSIVGLYQTARQLYLTSSYYRLPGE